MTSKDITTVIISDIHFGASSPTKLFDELNFFLTYIETLPSLDLIVIDGDYFHAKLYAQSDAIRLAIYFMDLIVGIAKVKDAKIRIVYGTESHDAMQYGVFLSHETNLDVDFKIIYKVTEEEIFENVHVLYLPEEYILDKKEYYSAVLGNEKKYDFIFGHGVIKEGMRMIHSNKKEEVKRLKPATFTVSDFKHCCKGRVYFGHYHVYTNIDDFVYYVGSYSRWIHGEEDPKGFIVDTMTKKGKHTTKFMENADAPVYRSFTFGYGDDIFKDEESTLNHLKTLQNIANDECIDKVRFVFNIPETYKNPEFFIKCVKDAFASSKKVSLLFTNGYIESKKSKNEEVLDEIVDRYDYILDKSLKMENILHEFIKDKHNKIIEIEDIQRYLYGNPVDDIRRALDE